MADTAAVIGAAARFLRAWTAATQGDQPLPLTHPLVVEAHEAARDLVWATGTKNLQAAFAVLDALVLAIKMPPGGI